MKRVYFGVWRLPWKLFVVLIFFGTALYSGISYYMAVETAGEIQALSWAVAQRVIVVDPGHGGHDPGAVGPSGALEKDITLVVGQKLAKKLGQAGAMVVMTRETDRDLAQSGEGTRKKRDLDARLSLIEQHQADLYLNIQVNALQSRRWSGAQTFFYRSNPEGEQLAKTIQRELIRVLGNTKRQALENNTTYMLKNVTIPAALIEVGFISNPREEKMLLDPAYQDKIAYAIYSGVARYLAGDVVK